MNSTNSNLTNARIFKKKPGSLRPWTELTVAFLLILTSKKNPPGKNETKAECIEPNSFVDMIPKPDFLQTQFWRRNSCYINRHRLKRGIFPKSQTDLTPQSGEFLGMSDVDKGPGNLIKLNLVGGFNPSEKY